MSASKYAKSHLSVPDLLDREELEASTDMHLIRLSALHYEARVAELQREQVRALEYIARLEKEKAALLESSPGGQP